MAVSVYKVAILLVLLISPVSGLKNNKFIKDMIYDVMVKIQRDHGCQLKATRAVIEWCTIPTGLNTTELKDDFVSFPQNTKCALKIDNSSVVCKGCYENRWYKTSCNHDPHVHRQKRFIGWIIAGIIALAVGCAILCRKRDEPHRPPSVSCTGPSEKRIYASKGSNTAVVKWQKPTGKNGKGNTLTPKQTDGKGDSGSSFERGKHKIGYQVTDNIGLTDYCSFSFEVAVHVCKPVEQPDNGKKDCDGVEMIWGKSCNISCNYGYVLQGSKIVTCEKNGTYDPPIPTCKVKRCPELSENEYDCPEKENYQSVCTKKCKEGYRATSPSHKKCTESGKWTTSPSVCKDVVKPEFKKCPGKPITVYADPGLTSATVTYGQIIATDNSGKPNVTLDHGPTNGSRFEEGAHYIRFKATDDDGNEETCTFNVSVIVLRCDVPDYNDTYMDIKCPTWYLLGSQCSIGCRFGLPLVGPNNITCEKDDSNPPKTSWGFSLDTPPSCKKIPCKNLTAPLNGALVCDSWLSGTFCNVMCNSNFDLPRGSNTERLICGFKSGQWSPTDKVADCTEARRPRRMVLPSEFYYFDGDCTTSSDVIKNNFLQALQNSDIWEQACPVPKDCTVENVVVKCGPTSGRKKRNVQSQRYKREVNELLITFKIVIPFSVDGASKEDARDISVAKLNSIADGIKREVVNGVFNNVAPGFTIRNDSVNFGWEDFDCPEGQIANYASISCRGCPTGTMYNRTEKDCTFCHKGTYQDEAFSMSCKSCPENTSTIDEGSRNANNCLAICGIGESSPTGLTPCSPCQIGSYQDTENSQTCKKCPADTSSLTGSTSLRDCKGFDVVLTGPIKLTSKLLESDMDNFTLSVWFQYKSLNSNFTISLIKEERSTIVVDFANDITIYINDVALTTLPRNSEWTNFVLTWLNLNKSLKVYLGGQLVSTKTVSSLESNLLENASMEIKLTEGNELAVRQLQLSDILLDDATIENSSQTCELTTSQHLISLNGFRPDNKTNLSIVMPSTCDAVNECLSSPCGQHVCINELSGFKCKCSDGYTGDMCNISPDYCLSHGCNHGATCNSIATNKSYTCTCPKGYKGTLCDVTIVNGGWGKYTDWSECSTTCGGGTSSRHRLCDNPSPDEDGEPCHGDDTEVKPCNTDKCPECKARDLSRAYGSSVKCTGTTSRLNCKMICRPGTVYNGEETPNYTCMHGVWSPGRKLLPCTEVASSRSLQIQTVVNFPYPAICEDSGAFKNEISNKVREDTCGGSNTCQYDVIIPECSQGNRRKRDVDTAVTILLTKELPEGDLDLAAYQADGTISPQLKATVEAVGILELSGQMLQNQTENFTVTVNNVVYKASSVNVNGKTICQPGSIGQAGVCGVCAEGTYENGNQCIDCNYGYYQDERGTVECKQCPSGWTTPFIGSVDESSCSVPPEMPSEPEGSSTTTAKQTQEFTTITTIPSNEEGSSTTTAKQTQEFTTITTIPSDEEGTTTTIVQQTKDFTTITTRQSQDDQSDEEDNKLYTFILAVCLVVVCVIVVTTFVCLTYYVCKENRTKKRYMVQPSSVPVANSYKQVELSYLQRQ